MKYKVKMTRTETYSYEQEVEAKSEDEALEIVESDETWRYPDEWDDVEVEHEITKLED